MCIRLDRFSIHAEMTQLLCVYVSDDAQSCSNVWFPFSGFGQDISCYNSVGFNYFRITIVARVDQGLNDQMINCYVAD